jgi:hypothetical protein
VAREVRQTAQGIVSGSGSVTLNIPGPHRIGYRWNLATVVISSVRAATGYPTASIYLSAVVPSALLGESRTADKVTFDASTDVMRPGDRLIIVIANALAGSTAVANLFAVEVEGT